MASVAAEPDAVSSTLKNVKHVVLVLSGKGGVGKSTVSVQIALSLVAAGHKVGLLDVDLCGPSIPTMLHLQNHKVHQCPQGWVPVFADQEQRLSVMSIAFLLDRQDDPVVWRGPKKTAMIKQFLADVYWGELDYLIVDTPPGTSDEHISMVENLRKVSPDGAVLVTTPQAVSTNDVKKELNFCIKAHLPILGIVENMSGFVCPHCAECSNVFSSKGGELLAAEFKVPFLGRVPLDPLLTQSLESGQSFVALYPESATRTAIDAIVKPLLALPPRF
ncbi:nucleotide-binding protein 2 [Capsaspora owczarzaki ATCC 30864]|uniref:Cytosolic Fe-S cluster assembly factor NUBP2 homolog n=1 Tax=Capsaspora owczarzaki (strain ATCC 30864) TaxID=595528 RepID=A0A0D2X2X3_CAPO3|nr:nucleotide-binding protein 2 [Capsaspora owczarzaki ATCC 30864]KJE93309.1 nucleotide-binding protein 2 [Capsaspora owczarzaki ATCC 30864]|eukprot:XP_004347940.1 nucleotide-binding protein 2 [Capsaspora owczarzaki ATCC 30864]